MAFQKVNNKKRGDVLLIKTLHNLLIVLTVVSLLSSCVYVNFSRQYEVKGSELGNNHDSIVKFFKNYFLGKELIFKEHYRNVTNPYSTHLVFELARESKDKRRDSYVIVVIDPQGVISIEQNEWFLSVTPFPNREPHKPIDYIESIRANLTQELINKFGSNIEIRFIGKSYY